METLRRQVRLLPVTQTKTTGTPPQSAIGRLNSTLTGGTLPAMTVLDDSSRDLKRELADLQRRRAERDSENAELQRRLADRESELAEADAQQAATTEVLQ